MRWSKLNQDELTALLRGMGLPAQGTKKELARRLGDHIESLGPPPPELAAANADSNSRRKALAAASSEDPGAHSEATGPASDDAVSELLSAEGAAGSTGRSGRSGGRRNRIHPRNWGYTTYLDRVFGMRCFNEPRTSRRVTAHCKPPLGMEACAILVVPRSTLAEPKGARPPAAHALPATTISLAATTKPVLLCGDPQAERSPLHQYRRRSDSPHGSAGSLPHCLDSRVS